MRVLVVPDKFKGTLSATAAAQAIADGWRRRRPGDDLELLPMSDGGDGFGEVFQALLGAKVQTTKTVDAGGRPCTARWWWAAGNRCAIVESATVIGLAMLRPPATHPFERDTAGLGAVLAAARRKGARRCLMGIGGSATNDGGFGLARAVGWRFLDKAGRPIEQWTRLSELERLVPPRRKSWPAPLCVAVDVRNPLLGREGATRVYGPQKGLSANDLAQAERCLTRLARVTSQYLGRSIATIPGAGAAGGLGFGLKAFLGAQLEPGFELFVRHARLMRRLKSADLVITGEGQIDKSTMMGKGVGELAKRCRIIGVPCIALAGHAEPRTKSNPLLAKIQAMTGVTTMSEAKARPAFWLARLAESVAESW